jgi:superfamily II DNA/RNA helicase
VAARGIHVEGIAAVIHHDPPADEKAYIHRSGRTARAGRSGLVVSLLQADQVADARRIQRKLGLDIPITSPDLGPRSATPAAHGPAPQPEPTDRTHARPRARTGSGRPLPAKAAKPRRARNRRRSTSRAGR